MRKRLDTASTGLCVIDVQERLFPLVDRSQAVARVMAKTIKGFQILGCPIFVTEQYPQGLGSTIPLLKDILGQQQQIFSKTSFSAYADASIKKAMDLLKVDTWLLIGIEAHVCVLQTAHDLVSQGRSVVVLNDAISSRSAGDFSTAVADMREGGVRVATMEMALFELLADASHTSFKGISQLIKHA